MTKTIETTAEVAAFGRRLKLIRAARGISQRWLAAEAGVPYSSVAFYETGRVQPTADSLARLADVLGYTMDELWRGVGRCEGFGG